MHHSVCVCACVQEVLKALVNAGDVVGIYFALNQKAVGGEARVLSVGLGTCRRRWRVDACSMLHAVTGH
jgi:hypothetical protein